MRRQNMAMAAASGAMRPVVRLLAEKGVELQPQEGRAAARWAPVPLPLLWNTMADMVPREMAAQPRKQRGASSAVLSTVRQIQYPRQTMWTEEMGLLLKKQAAAAELCALLSMQQITRLTRVF
ncbi:hypothetical protein [Falsochrobactrum shanghaiense]|uniref:hypothetical protein n=1 Tax=Falsochrobactrum shanghaiense TaxID=2201899 RepID=UPI001FE0B458|nr:hypothetical protein [Falsochrobactrum shanghaiense]